MALLDEPAILSVGIHKRPACLLLRAVCFDSAAESFPKDTDHHGLQLSISRDLTGRNNIKKDQIDPFLSRTQY
jgi:hypothetical protein